MNNTEQGTEKPHVFISWSGDRDREIAECLKLFLEDCVDVECFVSSKCIKSCDSGWKESIQAAIKKADYGIVLISKKTLHAPWLYYEGGALEGRLNFENVTIMAIDCEKNEVIPPFSLRHIRKFNKEDFELFFKELPDALKLKTKKAYNGRLWNSIKKKIEKIFSKYGEDEGSRQENLETLDLERRESVDESKITNKSVLNRKEIEGKKQEESPIITSDYILRKKEKERIEKAQKKIDWINSRAVKVKIIKHQAVIDFKAYSRGRIVYIDAEKVEQLEKNGDIEIIQEKLVAVQILKDCFNGKKGIIKPIEENRARAGEEIGFMKILHSYNDAPLSITRFEI